MRSVTASKLRRRLYKVAHHFLVFDAAIYLPICLHPYSPMMLTVKSLSFKIASISCSSVQLLLKHASNVKVFTRRVMLETLLSDVLPSIRPPADYNGVCLMHVLLELQSQAPRQSCSAFWNERKQFFDQTLQQTTIGDARSPGQFQ